MSTADVYRALWRHKIFIVTATIVVGVVAWVLTAHQAKTYEAETLVRIQQQVDNPGEAFAALQTGGRLAETYAQIVATDTIAHSIVRAVPDLRLPDVKVDGRQVNDLDLLSIRARSHDPHTAAVVANAAPDALKTFISATGTMRDRIIVVQPALAPRSPMAPRPVLNVVIALMLALILNGSLALLLDARSDRVRDLDDLEKIAGAPVLAVVPRLDLVPAPQARPAPPPRISAVELGSSRLG